MDTITLTIDNEEVKAEKGVTVLEAALSAGIYIPALCYHPDLPPAPRMKIDDHVYRGGELVRKKNPGPKDFEGCQLCIVEIEGMEGFLPACDTLAEDGMVVNTNTRQILELRREKLARILAKHPHACLICAEREGCSREPCSLNVSVEERCCEKFGSCELQKVAECIGIPEDTPRYVFRDFPIEETTLFVRDHNLCVECGRCVRACRDLRGVEALGIVYSGEGFVAGTVGPSLEASGCRFCGACVEVCPTGAIMDRDLGWPVRDEDLVPCKNACPAGVDVPRYIRLICEGRFAEAAAVIRERVPFPLVLGHVCHHPCEIVCRRGRLNESMTIRALKRFALGHETSLPKVKPKTQSGKRIAVIGSGPAGLTAAYHLARKGHSVTVFEAMAEPGGMMWMGIPEFRLPKDVVRREIENILEQGVELRLNTPFGDDLTLDYLKTQGYGAVFFATGAQVSRRVGVEGEELDGAVHAIPFLKKVNSGEKVDLGDRIGVIGGGDVAIDAARTAVRLKCGEVHLLYRRSREEMPADPEQVKQGEKEGVNVHFLVAPKRILGKDGRVTGLECVRMRLGEPDESGRRRPLPIEGSEYRIGLDGVIVAIGQSPDVSCLPDGLKLTKRNTIAVNPDTLETSLPGVFAGGDVVTGPASIVDAVAQGKKAAVSIDKYLGGDGVIDETLIKPEKPDPWLGPEEGFPDKRRVQVPHLPIERRLRDFSLVELGFDVEEAVEEAKRCLRCDLRLEISPVVLPPERWLEFSAENVSKVPETSGVYQLLDEKKVIVYIAGTPNLRRDLEQHLKTIPKARYFGYEEEPMYTKRESELIQKFLKEHGRMPELNEELLDLF
ncbi:MAG: FAD-dependent oxidoreductase [Candidatus Bathyarchaeia archaeon]